MNLNTKQLQTVTSLLKSIANENRLAILCSLTRKECHVNELCDILGENNQSSVSQHLIKLKREGLVACEKRGQYVYYRINDERIISLMESLKEHFCGGKDE